MAGKYDNAIMMERKCLGSIPMRYCESVLKIEKTRTPSEALSAFTSEQFNVNQAHSMDGRQFNTDAELNDIRAIRQVKPDTDKIFCRYAYDVQKTQSKILDFAKEHSVECRIVDLESVRKQRYWEQY